MTNAIELDLSQVPIAKLRQVIADRASSDHGELDLGLLDVKLTHAHGQDFVGAGFSQFRKVTLEGSLGLYACAGLDSCECIVEGDAGDFLAHSIRSGIVIVKGHAGNSVGSMGRGGFVAVHGNAGNQMGVSMRGADVFVRGNAGHQAGIGMRSGTIIIGGSAGNDLGVGMTGGTIFLRGDAMSISRNIEEQRLREPDRFKIGLLLLNAGIKSAVGKEFRLFRPVDGGK